MSFDIPGASLSGVAHRTTGVSVLAQPGEAFVLPDFDQKLFWGMSLPEFSAKYPTLLGKRLKNLLMRNLRLSKVGDLRLIPDAYIRSFNGVGDEAMSALSALRGALSLDYNTQSPTLFGFLYTSEYPRIEAGVNHPAIKSLFLQVGKPLLTFDELFECSVAQVKHYFGNHFIPMLAEYLCTIGENVSLDELIAKFSPAPLLSLYQDIQVLGVLGIINPNGVSALKRASYTEIDCLAKAYNQLGKDVFRSTVQNLLGEEEPIDDTDSPPPVDVIVALAQKAIDPYRLGFDYVLGKPVES